jgi:hypothetical protein
LSGFYKGQFNHQVGVLEISYLGNKPVVRFLDPQNLHLQKDLLNENCRSSINQIKSAIIENENGEHSLKSAEFAFNSGLCFQMAIGKILYLSFTNDYQEVKVDLLERYDQPCPGSQNDICDRYPTYLQGFFTKY